MNNLQIIIILIIIVMLVNLWWWLISDVGGRIIMLVTFFVRLVIFSMYKIGHHYRESVTNHSNLPPTHLVLNLCHQHRCNPRTQYGLYDVDHMIWILSIGYYPLDNFSSEKFTGRCSPSVHCLVVHDLFILQSNILKESKKGMLYKVIDR